MNPTEVKQSAVNPVDEDTIDIKKIIFTVLRNWYWFVLSVVLFGGLAIAYNRYATPVYEICTTMLVEEEKVTSPLLGGGAGATSNIFQGLGVMNSMRNISNQMVILSSTPIISKTLEELDFEVSYFAQGRVAVSERYHEVPYQVIWDKDHPQIIETDFSVSIQPDGKLMVSVDEKNAAVYSYPDDRVVSTIPKFSFSKTINAGEKLSSHDFSFSILLNEKFNPKDANNYKFRFHSKSSLIKKYQESLTVSLPDKETSIIMLALRDFNVQKGMDFLNRLTEIYHLDNLSKKNENANRTIQFI
ncbi:MAG: hypothetical protein EOM73_10485, partial [Bacteroidia bacterium]|nr:hypothetical protein [Bacteroidia bacterium]